MGSGEEGVWSGAALRTAWFARPSAPSRTVRAICSVVTTEATTFWLTARL